MMRLILSGVEEADGSAVSARLRGATLTVAGDSARLLQLSVGCQAAVLSGRQDLDRGVAERLLRAGKHVLVAMDSCVAPGDLDHLANVAREANVQLGLVNPDHYLPSRQLMRAQLDAGRLGDVGLVRSHRWEPATEANPQGQQLPGALVRDLELACWLFGRAPDLVYAVAPALGRGVQVQLGFPAGGTALIGYADDLPPGDGYQSLALIGSAGAAYADEQQNMQLLFGGGQARAVRTGEGLKQLALLIQEFVDALSAGKDLAATLTPWRAAWAAAHAVERALATRQAVPLGAS